MDLELTEEQQMLQQMVSRLCQQYADRHAVRQAEASDDGVMNRLWEQLIDLGLTGLVLPESAGGTGSSLLDVALVYEVFGRHLAATPHWISCVLCARLLWEISRAGVAADSELLTSLTSGAAIATLVWPETQTAIAGEEAPICATESAGNWLLQGSHLLLPYASVADHLLVLAPVNGRSDDYGLYAVEQGAEGLTLHRQPTHAGGALFALHCENVRGRCLGRGEAVLNAWRDVQAYARVPLAAQAVGGAQAILEMTTQYAKERHAFGQPIGAFQSIAHYLADMATEVESARLLVWQAAWAYDQGVDRTRLPLMAKDHAGRVFRHAAATGVQIHGGLGFSLEADPQLYYRRAKQWQLLFGDPLSLGEQIADQVLGSRVSHHQEAVA